MQCGLLGRKLGHSYSPQIHAMLGSYGYALFEKEPEALEDFSERHPEVKALLVPVEQFAETRRKMETAGTAEAILYHKIKSEL